FIQKRYLDDGFSSNEAKEKQDIRHKQQGISDDLYDFVHKLVEDGRRLLDLEGVDSSESIIFSIRFHFNAIHIEYSDVILKDIEQNVGFTYVRTSELVL
ncbi:hypothetical protein Tco_1066416, partial [Tanacetum coccineum]